MKNSIIILFLCCLFKTEAQSVFDCAAYPNVTPAMINSANPDLFQGCIQTDAAQTYNYSGASNKKLISASEIHVNPGGSFHAGPYTTGKMWLKVDNKSPFDVAVMNYDNLGSVLRYEKLELGVKLPDDVQSRIFNFINEHPTADKTNPFVDWELKVETTFTHMQTLTTKKIDGFYYRDFERGSGVWLEKLNDYKFRVRFSPPLNGMWMATVKIILNGVQHSVSGAFTFNVIESGNPGYVKVHENQKNFKRGNDVVFPVGQNFPWPAPNDVWYWGRSTPKEWATYLEYIQEYADLGGDFVRSLVHPRTMDIEWEKVGNYYDRLDYAWEMDNMIELIEENDMMLDLNILFHNVIENLADYGQFGWDFGELLPTGGDCDSVYPASMNTSFPPFGYRVQLGLSEPKELFTNPQAFAYLKQRARYLISRYGYSTNIYMFELGSEMYHLNDSWDYGLCAINEDADEINMYEVDPSVRAAVYQYHTEMSQFIKNTMGHTEHLLGADYSLTRMPNTPDYLPDNSFALSTIDVICANYYDPSPDKLWITDDNNTAKTISKLHNSYQKPVFLSEAGHAGKDVCNYFQGAYIDLMSVPFVGAAGMNLWHGYEKFESYTFDEIARAKDHMNASQDLGTILNSYWLKGGGKSKDGLKDHQYYVAENRERAAGYVRNRTFNTYTLNDGSTLCNVPNAESNYNSFQHLGWDKSLVVGELKPNTDYRIHWYSYRTGTYMSTDYFNTTSGGRKVLEHPLLYLDPMLVTEPDYTIRPVLWYVIEQYNWGKPEGESTGEEGSFIIEDKLPEQKLSVSPNPFSSEVEITSNRVIGEIEVIDVRGNTILTKTIPEYSHKLDLHDLANGIYLVKIVKTGEVLRIVKQ